MKNERTNISGAFCPVEPNQKHDTMKMLIFPDPAFLPFVVSQRPRS